jgi:putative sigma-54 modulation protein
LEVANMQVQVRGKGVVITDALREYADKKVNKLTKHFGDLQGATVVQTIQGKTHRVEVQLEGDGITVRSEDRGDDLYAAIDRVVDKLERQMQKYRDRRKRFGNGVQRDHESLRYRSDDNETIVDEPVGRIVRQKKFAIKPISDVEAVAQMELLSHDFFVFENADTGQVNVLYRREDGNYGLLEPER